MRKFEYRFLESVPSPDLQRVLNMLGRQGYRIIRIDRSDPYFDVIMEREVEVNANR